MDRDMENIQNTESVDWESQLLVQSEKIAPSLLVENDLFQNTTSVDAVNHTSEFGHADFDLKPATANEFSFLNMLLMDSASVDDGKINYENMDCREDSNVSQFEESDWASAYKDFEINKNDVQPEASLYTEDNLKEDMDRQLDDQYAKMQNFTPTIYDSHAPADAWSEEYQGIDVLLSSAVGMSLGFEERVDLNVELSKSSIEDHFDKTSREDSSVAQIATVSDGLASEAPVLCELFTSKEKELKLALEIAQQEAELKKQSTKETGEKKVTKRKAKNKVDEKVTTKTKKGEKTAKKICFIPPRKGKKIMTIMPEKEENIPKVISPAVEEKTSVNEKGYTIKMQTVNIRNEKELAPPERMVKMFDNGGNNLKFANEINMLRKEKIASNLLRRFTSKTSKPKEKQDVYKAKTSKPKEKQGVYKGEKRAPKTTADDYKSILVSTRKINTSLKKACGMTNEEPLDEKDLVKLFDDFLGYPDVMSSAINLLPHFVLTVICAKDCVTFSSSVKFPADKVYSHLCAIYEVPPTDKFEAKYVAAVKKMGKVNSRKGRVFLKDISMWN